MDIQLILSSSRMNVIDVSTKSVQVNVDEGTASDYEVNDFWLFEYDDEGGLIGAPTYYLYKEFKDLKYVSMIIPDPGKEFKVVVIANTHNPNLLSSLSYNTLDALSASYIEVHSSLDMVQESGTSCDLLMNGVFSLYDDTRKVNCNLYRNVAKLEVKLVNGRDTGITIRSLQLRSVPDRIFLVDQLYSNEATFPNLSESGFRSLEKDLLELSPGSESEWVRYYLPRNMRGKNLSTTETDKNINVPDNATYLEVVAVKEKGIQVIYRFYPGENDIDDFNLVPNHSYRFLIDFKALGDPNDTRVEDMSHIVLEESNSYLINPSVGRVKYTVPIENRINTYWSSESGRKNPDWQKYLVNSEKEWVAEVIWKDTEENLLVFVDDDGNTSASYNGRRDDRYFSFEVDEFAPGNVLIGVRRKGSLADPWTKAEGYMWSWHVWVTDYNPYEDVGEWQDGKYIYELSGNNGSLHRYAALDRIEMYKNRYLMDRNLGAKGYAKSDGVEKSTGMFYQYGRKDPFPASDRVYDGNSQSLTLEFVSAEGINIHDAVMSPLKYYTKSSGDWLSDDTYRGYSWNDLNEEVKKGEGKSFFDPCPPGWQLHVYQVWGDFDKADKCDWTITGTKFDAGWMVDLTASAEDEEVAYFPASGLRLRTTGALNNSGTVCALWSVTEEAGEVVRYSYFEKDRMLKEQPGAYRAMGLPVRCITSRDSK